MAQRLKLASEIGKSQKNSVFIFDEPTIGLHPLDIQVLIDVFDHLIDKGATVVVIEHDLDLIANADYIIDMGIDEDYAAGEILASGSLDDIIECEKSFSQPALIDVGISAFLAISIIIWGATGGAFAIGIMVIMVISLVICI